MELVVTEIKKQEIYITNFDELEKEIITNLKKYEGLVLTEENKSEIKDIKSKLNKLIKAIDRERIDKTKEYNEPLQKFIEQCNILKSKVLEVSGTFDKQLKEAEEKEKQAKLEEIIKYFDENVGEYKELIDFDKIFQDQWLNKGYTIKKVQMDVDHIFSKTNMDLATIDGQYKDETIRVQVKDFYFKNINQSTVLSLAIQEGTRLIESIEKITKTDNLNTKEEEKITNPVQIVQKSESIAGQKSEQLVGRVFELVCSQEKLEELNKFLISSGGYSSNVLERFEILNGKRQKKEKILTLDVNYTEEYGGWGDRSQNVVNEENDISFGVCNLSECPEDAIIGRDLFDVEDYIRALNKGIELAKNGYDKIEIGKKILEEEE